MLLITFQAISLGMPCPALAQAGRVAGEKANVRAAPSIEGELLGTLTQGCLVQIVAQQGDWYQVAGEQYSGYIRSDLLEIATDVSYVEITGNPVNLRSGPGTDCQILGQVSKGFTLLYVGKQGDWYKGITPSGTVAFVRSDMARLNGPDSTASVKPDSEPEPASPPGDSVSDNACKVYLNGSRVSFDVQPRMENQRLLVPFRAIFEAAGATVSYDAGSRTVFARRGDTSITLPLNSTCPIVNGRIWSIDVPARIIDNRTLVPLRFAGEAMGGTVTWDDSSQTAAISLPESGNDPAGPNDSGDNNSTPAPSASEGLQMSATRNNDGLSLTIQADRQVEAEATKDYGLVRYTFPGIKADGVKDLTEKLGSAGVLKASVRNEGDSAIVEVSWPADIDYKSTELDNGRGFVFTLPNFVAAVSREKYGSVGERLMIETLCPVEYSSTQKGGEVELVLKGANMGLARNRYSLNEYLVGDVKVSATGTGDQSTRFEIETSNVGRSSFVVSGDGDNVLNMILIDKDKIWTQSSHDGPVILDPGHGGTDGGAPGAVSNEKDVNLAIALKVRSILESKGIKVEMTRDGDYFMGLEDRSDLANAVNGSLFVSIQANASDENPGARGTETYFYAPLEEPQLYAQRQEREALARAIQNKLLFYCGTTDRGVKEDNYSVLRETSMPAALTEVAFMSNAADETLLNSTAFQQMAARAIAEGIMEYMND